MRHGLRSLFCCCTLATTSLIAVPWSARADWTEDFSGGMTPLPWVIRDDMNTRPPDRTTISYTNNNLRMVGQLASPPALDLYVVAVVGLDNLAFSFGDVRVAATVSSTTGTTLANQPALGNNDTFVIARVQAGGNSGYVLALDFQSGEVDLVRSDNATITELNASGNVPNFNPASSYQLELTADGSNLMGRVLSGGIPVVTVSTTDTAFTSGWSGVGSAINENEALDTSRTTIAAIFDDVSSTTITHTVSADLNQDGVVDRSDVALFTAFYGLQDNATALTGDFSGDERVGLSDLIILRNQLTPSPSPTAVPEPWTAALALLAGCLLFSSYRRRNS